MMTITTLGNEKGGVGKTSLALGLASELQRQGRNVLLVDLDPQCGVTKAITHYDQDASNVEHLLQEKRTVDIVDVIQATQWDGIYAIPGSRTLENIELDRDPFAFMRLRDVLADTRVREAFDDVLIDTPPAIGTTKTLSALYAADRVLAVTSPEPMSIEGLDGFLQAVDKMREKMRSDLPEAQIIVNAYDSRLTDHHEGIHILRRAVDHMVLDPYVPRRSHVVRMTKEDGQGQRLHDVGTQSALEASEALVRLAKHLIETAPQEK